ncbi:MAG: ABC transporter ATP-binding protein [Rhodobacteraceae bacterium]|nr:ABC transporter ATP-binding protein [Paracoccaceae bacterium]
MARVELKQVTKAWGDVVAVEPTDLVIENGEFVAVLGPSGCGKSTTLFMLAGIYAPTSGAILFDGHEMNAVEPKDRNIGIVFQSYALYPHMNVRDNIAFPLKFQKLPKSEAIARAEDVARLVHVDELLDRKPSQLSGGQQQRVALARALVKQPNLLLLDEPLSNLDATLRLTMRTEIKALQKRTGITTILVTHDQLEATTMADRIICMSRGRIEQIGTPEDFYSRPASLFVAKFIGSPPLNLVEGTGREGRFQTGGASLRLGSDQGAPPEGGIVAGLRPEMLTFGPEGIAGEIVAIEPMGRETLYILDTDLGGLRVLESRPDRTHTVGQKVHVSFDAAETVLFDAATETRIAGAWVAV